MLARRDGRHHTADVHAVLDHRRVLRERLDGELVPDRDVGLRVHLDFPVLVHDPAGELLAGLHALDHDDADGIAFVVHHEMDHLPLSGRRDDAKAQHVHSGAGQARHHGGLKKLAGRPRVAAHHGHQAAAVAPAGRRGPHLLQHSGGSRGEVHGQLTGQVLARNPPNAVRAEKPAHGTFPRCRRAAVAGNVDAL